MKTVLVTGGSGLVGSAIKNFIGTNCAEDETWHFVNSKSADLSKYDATKAMFEQIKPTHVIHLAAMVGGLFHNMSHNLDFLRTNIAINDNVLQCSFESEVEKVVSCLSTCIFPDKTSYPIDETMIHKGPPHPSNFGYSYAKRLIDVYNKAYFDQHKAIYTAVIPCNVFGTHDNFSLETSHVIPALIRKLHDIINEEGNTEDAVFTVLGSGKPLRQFIYAPDLAELIVWALRDYPEVEPLILAPDASEERPISVVASSIAEAFDFKGQIIFDKSKADGQFLKTACNAKFRTYLPDYKFTPFSKAIKETVEWYKHNHSLARK